MKFIAYEQQQKINIENVNAFYPTKYSCTDSITYTIRFEFTKEYKEWKFSDKNERDLVFKMLNDYLSGNGHMKIFNRDYTIKKEEIPSFNDDSVTIPDELI